MCKFDFLEVVLVMAMVLISTGWPSTLSTKSVRSSEDFWEQSRTRQLVLLLEVPTKVSAPSCQVLCPALLQVGD